MSAADQIERLLNAEQVAEVLGVSVRTVHRLVEDGRLEPVRLGHRTVRYRPANVAALVAAHEAGGEAD